MYLIPRLKTPESKCQLWTSIANWSINGPTVGPVAEVAEVVEVVENVGVIHYGDDEPDILIDISDDPEAPDEPEAIRFEDLIKTVNYRGFAMSRYLTEHFLKYSSTMINNGFLIARDEVWATNGRVFIFNRETESFECNEHIWIPQPIENSADIIYTVRTVVSFARWLALPQMFDSSTEKYRAVIDDVFPGESYVEICDNLRFILRFGDGRRNTEDESCVDIFSLSDFNTDFNIENLSSVRTDSDQETPLRVKNVGAFLSFCDLVFYKIIKLHLAFEERDRKRARQSLIEMGIPPKSDFTNTHFDSENPRDDDESKDDEPKHDEPEHDESKDDEPKHDEPEHDEPKHDEPKHDEPKHDETQTPLRVSAVMQWWRIFVFEAMQVIPHYCLHFPIHL